MEPILRASLKILFVLGLILDFSSIKWRWLAKWLFYLEIFTRFLGSGVPNYASQDYDRINYAYLIMLLFCTFYCLDGKQIIFSTLLHLWNVTFALSVVYNRSMDYVELGFSIVETILIFLFATCIAMMFVHISRMHSFLVITNQDNSKLLNSMHEGILILSKTDKSVILSN